MRTILDTTDSRRADCLRAWLFDTEEIETDLHVSGFPGKRYQVQVASCYNPAVVTAALAVYAQEFGKEWLR